MGGSGLFGGESSAQKRARKKAEEAAKQASAKAEGDSYVTDLDRRKKKKLETAKGSRERTLATLQGNITNKRVGLAGKNVGKTSYAYDDEDEGGFVK